MFYGWFVAVAAFCTLLLTVGVPFYAMPFFYDFFIAEFGWSRAATTGGVAFATLLIQPIGGLLIARFSPRRLVVFGAVVLAAAMASFGAGTGSLPLYYLSWCAFMVGYVYSGPIPHQVLLANWFQRRRGRVMGFAYLGLGLGGALSQKYVAMPLIDAFGWRGALSGIGALVLLAVPIALFVVRDSPADFGLQPDGVAEPAPGAAAPAFSLSELFRRSAFWLLAIGSLCSIGAIGSVNQHMKLLFQDAGLDGATVADTTFLLLVSSLAGRVAMGWLADVIDIKRVMVAAYLLVAAPLPLLLMIDRPGMPEIFAVLFGFGLGADYMLIPLMAAHQFGTSSLARAMGVILPADSIGQTCFPFLLGALRDAQGDYVTGIAVITGLALIGVTSIAMLSGPAGAPKKRTI